MMRLRLVHRSSGQGAESAIITGGTIAFLIILLGAAGCETTEGFGRDLENLGDDIEDAAEENDVE